MVFSLFEYLDSANYNHRQYAQIWQFFHKKKAITFFRSKRDRNLETKYILCA